jgi:CheY-like chemotaxis protein
MTALQILLVEDSDPDAELLEKLLQSEGLDFRLHRARNKQEYIDALVTRSFHVVLCDYSLPSFDAMSALKIARERSPGVMFIVVTGVLPEEAAIASMSLGVDDYVLKGRLTKLVPILRRLIDVGSAARDIRIQLSLYRRVFSENKSGLFILDGDFRFILANDCFCDICDATQTTILNNRADKVITSKTTMSGIIATLKTSSHWLGYVQDTSGTKTLYVTLNKAIDNGSHCYVGSVVRYVEH